MREEKKWRRRKRRKITQKLQLSSDRNEKNKNCVDGSYDMFAI